MAAESATDPSNQEIVFFFVKNIDWLLSFLGGVVAGFIANMLWYKWQLKKQGKSPYVDVSVNEETIKIAGVFRHDPSVSDNISNLLTSASSSSSQSSESE